MTIELLTLLWTEREFHRRSERANAEYRQDLTQAGVSRAELAAILGRV